MDDESTFETKTETVYNIVIGTVITVGIAVNVYLMVDAASDGELTKSVKRRWSQARSKWQSEKTFETDARKVVAEATWAAYEAATDSNGTSDNGKEDK